LIDSSQTTSQVLDDGASGSDLTLMCNALTRELAVRELPIMADNGPLARRVCSVLLPRGLNKDGEGFDGAIYAWLSLAAAICSDSPTVVVVDRAGWR